LLPSPLRSIWRFFFFVESNRSPSGSRQASSSTHYEAKDFSPLFCAGRRGFLTVIFTLLFLREKIDRHFPFSFAVIDSRQRPHNGGVLLSYFFQSRFFLLLFFLFHNDISRMKLFFRVACALPPLFFFFFFLPRGAPPQWRAMGSSPPPLLRLTGPETMLFMSKVTPFFDIGEIEFLSLPYACRPGRRYLPPSLSDLQDRFSGYDAFFPPTGSYPLPPSSFHQASVGPSFFPSSSIIRRERRLFFSLTLKASFSEHSSSLDSDFPSTVPPRFLSDADERPFLSCRDRKPLTVLNAIYSHDPPFPPPFSRARPYAVSLRRQPSACLKGYSPFFNLRLATAPLLYPAEASLVFLFSSPYMRSFFRSQGFENFFSFSLGLEEDWPPFLTDER